ncbi:cell wall / vacuolar inhibitor of fructosidase 1-like [Gastrolobium bilobum]|uniref:cell wall / vacuolar inhibitor of fructosidase 1-like n=1 Tax=Gastrolobium bilobum TaxID=150636 RepID=UPI002AB10792|nr:cell wall / vacuolar inhibitor of fructosidase 1-like [Gastrolobium bilobum]
MANLKHLSLICSILVLATISMPQGHCRVFQPNDVKLIEETCKNTSHPDLCIKLLEADPHSSSADVNDLALILVNVIKAKANDTMNKINELLKGGADEKGLLSSCANKYKAILEGDVPLATQALQSGKPEVAAFEVSHSVVEALSCEDDFTEKSPLFDENNVMIHAAEVTRDIIIQLL